MDMHKNNKNSELAQLAKPLGRGSVFAEAEEAETKPVALTVRPFEYRHPWLAAVAICLPTALATAMLLSLPGHGPLI